MRQQTGLLGIKMPDNKIRTSQEVAYKSLDCEANHGIRIDGNGQALGTEGVRVIINVIRRYQCVIER